MKDFRKLLEDIKEQDTEIKEWADRHDNRLEIKITESRLYLLNYLIREYDKMEKK